MEKDSLITRLQKENEKLVKYNKDLLNQIKLLSSKLSLFQKVGSQIGISFRDASTQTSDSPAKFENASLHTTEDDWKGYRNNTEKKVSDLVREAAEKISGCDDYVWIDHESRFYCKSSGWYYYPTSQLFLEPRSNKYYKFNPETKKHEYHSDAPDPRYRKKSSLLKHQTENLEPTDEEGEIISSDDSCDVTEHNLSDEDPVLRIKSIEDVAAARMIVKESQSLELGTLIVVPPIPSFIIGLDHSSDLMLTPQDLDCSSMCSLDHSHDYLMINYNEDVGSYELQPSKDGNNLLKCLKMSNVTQDGKVLIRHGCLLGLGTRNEFLIHVHDGKDLTCIQCEPGCVQASLKDRKSNSSVTDVEASGSSTSNLITHKQRLRDLKRRYGLEKDAFENPLANISSRFKDRSKERRIMKGSGNPYEKTASSSIDQHIPKENKGFKLLQKMGWTHGSSLGSRTSSGFQVCSDLIEPIRPELKADRSGFGTS